MIRRGGDQARGVITRGGDQGRMCDQAKGGGGVREGCVIRRGG